MRDNTDTRIIMTREYFVKFNCDFDLLMYPFDTQVCNMQLQECFMSFSSIFKDSPIGQWNPKEVHHNVGASLKALPHL